MSWSLPLTPPFSRAQSLLLAALGSLCITSAAAPPHTTEPPKSARTYPVTPAAPAILFTLLDERSVSFTADGHTAYFPVRIGDGYLQVLCTATEQAGKWTEPQVLPFSGGPAFDADPFISADGNTLYFASTRTADGPPKGDLDIWVANRDGNHWSTPHPLPGKVNTRGNERAPVLGASGRLYFSATRDGRSQLFYSDRTPDGFGPPIAFGDNINNDGDNMGLAVNPAEDILVFASLGRPDEMLAPGQGYPRGDLYMSRRTGADWGPVRHLPAPINSAAADLSPSFSRDGHWLYFMSERSFATNQDIVLTYDTLTRGLATSLNGRGNIYRVDARALEVQP